MFLLDKLSRICYYIDVPRENRKELRNMTENIIGAMRRLNNEEFADLREIVIEEGARRAQIADLVGEINEKLYELAGMLTGSDSLRITNNLTGEVMSDLNDWDEPDDDARHLAPELDVEIAVEREHKRPTCCPGAPVNCHECDDCPWDY